MRARARTAAVASLLAGCAALTGADALRVGPDVPDDPADTGAPDGDEASFDGRPEDVVSQDGGGDADAAPTYCQAQASDAATFFCDDFDTASLLARAWTPLPMGNGTVAHDTALFFSAARLLKLQVPGGSSARAFIARTFAMVPTREIAVSFRMRVSGLVLNDTHELVILRMPQSGPDYQMQLQMANQLIETEEESPLPDGAVPEVHTPLGGFTLDVWRKVTLRLVFAPTSSTMTVSIEGQAPISFAASAHLYKAAPEIELGDDALDDTPSAVYFDDFTVEIR